MDRYIVFSNQKDIEHHKQSHIDDDEDDVGDDDDGDEDVDDEDVVQLQCRRQTCLSQPAEFSLGTTRQTPPSWSSSSSFYTDGDHNDQCLQLTRQTNRQTDS